MENFVNFEKIIQLLIKLKKHHKISTIDIGALEPLLYHNSGKDIVDLRK
jgi:hypothetical protein